MTDPGTTSDVAHPALEEQGAKKTITVRVEPDLWREFRASVLREGDTVQHVVEGWLEDYVETVRRA